MLKTKKIQYFAYKLFENIKLIILIAYGMFKAKPVYCHTVSMTFDRAG